MKPREEKNAKLESSRLPTPEPKVNAPPQSSSLFVQSALLRWSLFSSFVQSCAGEWSQHLHVRKEHSFRRFVGNDLALKQQQTGAAWWKLRATGPRQQSSKASPRRLHRFPHPLQKKTPSTPNMDHRQPAPHPPSRRQFDAHRGTYGRRSSAEARPAPIVQSRVVNRLWRAAIHGEAFRDG